MSDLTRMSATPDQLRDPVFQAGMRYGTAMECERHVRVGKVLVGALCKTAVDVEHGALSHDAAAALIYAAAEELRTRIVSAEEHQDSLAVESLARKKTAAARHDAVPPDDDQEDVE